MVNNCEGCLQKQRQIDQLLEEVQRLKAKLRYQERKDKEGFFGSSTPSSQLPLKANTDKENKNHKAGARPDPILLCSFAPRRGEVGKRLPRLRRSQILCQPPGPAPLPGHAFKSPAFVR